MQTRHTAIASALGELILAADGETLTGRSGGRPESGQYRRSCHRVVGRNGRLTGYAGGLKRKRFLLDLEEPSPAVAGRLF